MTLGTAISVVVVSKDRPDLLARLLSNLLLQGHVDFDVTVCLNSDTSWSKDCDQAKRALAHRNVECKTFTAKGCSFSDMHHLLLAEAANDLVLRLDDDHIPGPDLLSSLLATMDSEPGIAAAAPIVLHPEQDALELAQPEFEEALARARTNGILYTRLQLYRHPTSNSLVVPDLYSTFLMRRSAALSVGGIARCYQVCGYREETDLTLRMTLAGFTVVIAPAAVVWHFRASTGGERRTQHEWSICTAENERIFRKRLESWHVRIPESFYHIWSLNNKLAVMCEVDC